jgi:hypothetical protein
MTDKVNWNDIDLQTILGTEYTSNLHLFNLMPQVFKDLDNNNLLYNFLDVFQQELDMIRRKIAVMMDVVYDINIMPYIILLKTAKFLRVPQNIINIATEVQLRNICKAMANININKGKADVLKNFIYFISGNNVRILSKGYFNRYVGSTITYGVFANDFYDLLSLYMDADDNNVIVDYCSNGSNNIILLFADYMRTIGCDFIMKDWDFFDIYPWNKSLWSGVDYSFTGDYIEISDVTGELYVGLPATGSSLIECLIDWTGDLTTPMGPEFDLYFLYTDIDNYLKLNIDYINQTIRLDGMFGGFGFFWGASSFILLDDKINITIDMEDMEPPIIGMWVMIYIDGKEFWSGNVSNTSGTAHIINGGTEKINLRSFGIAEKPVSVNTLT